LFEFIVIALPDFLTATSRHACQSESQISDAKSPAASLKAVEDAISLIEIKPKGELSGQIGSAAATLRPAIELLA